MYGIIYLITNKIDDKKYVGQTTRNINIRFAEHCRADSLIGRAIQKYGLPNFSIEIVAECTSQDELDEKERLYIEKFNCKHPNGYNTAGGGQHSLNPQNNKDSKISRRQFLLKVIGAKIAYYRTLRDMSQKELARKANISTSSLSKIERGKYNDNISVSLLMDIADGLQIDLTLLVTFSELEKNMWWKPIHE